LGDTQRQRLEAREEAILAAATSLFSESGVDGARMAEIARRADVAEGTVYLYYKT
jgi:TetR/AcrR family fatty acid metabolism transcriptional regulator